MTNVARLNVDGSVDPTYNAGAVGSIYALALQSDGKLIVSGANLTQLAGQTRTNIGRLNNTDAATQSLGFDGSTITWLRGGASPELSRASFEISTDGKIGLALEPGRASLEGGNSAGSPSQRT